MSVEAAEALLAAAGSQEGRWPLDRERRILTSLNTWAAVRETDRDALKRAANWRDHRRQYRVDNLGERISDAWAHYLFGEEPVITPAQGDEQLMADLVEANKLPSELERGAALCSSEGEIWPRIYVDELVAQHPLLDWVSRRNIFPVWAGNRLAAAAVVTELPRLGSMPKAAVARHFEVHAPGVVLNALYVGKEERLGYRRPLTEHPTTADLDETWETGVPGLLVGRIPNKLRGSKLLGVSDYKGILDYLLDLNEACAIGAYNAKLTARKRAVVSQAALNPLDRNDLDLTPEETDLSNAGGPRIPRATFDALEEVFVEDPLDTELGKADSTPFRVLEYDFDAEGLIRWKRELVESAVSRAGLDLQYVGGPAEGVSYAISGTALRLRLIPTDKAGKGKGRYMDDAVPRILQTMAVLEGSLFGRRWNTDKPPGFKRSPGIPVDEVEEAQKHSTLVSGGLLSLETSLRERYPGQTDDWYAEEVERIRADKAAGGGASLPGPFGA